jgi:hypothetical protein
VSATRFPNSKPEFRSCLRKRRYTRNEALKSIANIKRNTGHELYLYRCPFAEVVHHWHITKDRQS